MNIIQLLKNKLFCFNNYEFDDKDIFYVAGSQTLPPPLETVEEEKLIQKLENENDFMARQTLVERNLRLVVYIAKNLKIQVLVLKI